jgi:predicted DCC family thiol-disulfide oxidoreductase YuxK
VSERIIAAYDAECAFCVAAAATSRICESSVRWVPAAEWPEMGPEPESVLVIDEAGRPLIRSAAVAAIVGQWRLIGPPAAAVMRRFEAPLDTVYDFVARNRQALGAPIRLWGRLAARLSA